MKNKSFSMKFAMAALSAAMVTAPAINVFAAPEDIIDTTKKANLTIHKYDITAAKAAGVDVSKYKANGKKNDAAETALKNYAIEGVQFTYQKVGNICTESVAGKIQVMYEIPAALEEILGLKDTRGDHKHTSDEVNGAMKTLLTDPNVNTASKDKLEKYIQTGSGAKTMADTDKTGVTKATNLPLGLYLIVETKVPANVTTTVDPFFVSLPMTDLEGSAWFYDVDVYPKNQTNIPDLDKMVRQGDDADKYKKTEYSDTTTASEGDRIDYILVSHLPKISSSATYLTKYTFVDKISQGLAYGKDVAVYFYNSEADAKANNKDKAVTIWEKGSPYFSQNYSSPTDKPSELTVEMTAEGLKALNHVPDGQQYSDYSDKYMVVSYSATITSDDTPVLGDKGNTNDAKLTWSRTNMKFSDTLEDRAKVFSYGINLKKNFKSDDATKKGDPTKVQFSLQNKTHGYFVTATQKNPGSGVYYVTDKTKGAAEKNGTVFSPAADGTLIINGLEADTYEMVELQTDAGFTLLKEPITIKINQTKDEITPSKTTLYDTAAIAANKAAHHDHLIDNTSGERASATVDGKTTEMEAVQNTTTGEAASTSANARVKMSVTNTPGFGLPNTGGAGTIAFTVAGCAVAFAGIAVVTKKSKKQEDQDK